MKREGCTIIHNYYIIILYRKTSISISDSQTVTASIELVLVLKKFEKKKKEESFLFRTPLKVSRITG